MQSYSHFRYLFPPLYVSHDVGVLGCSTLSGHRKGKKWLRHNIVTTVSKSYDTSMEVIEPVSFWPVAAGSKGVRGGQRGGANSNQQQLSIER